MSTEIRPLVKADEIRWRYLWGLYNEFYNRTVPDNVTTTTLARFLDPSVRMYCAVAVDLSPNKNNKDDDDNSEIQIIGFVTWYPHPSTSSIEEVVYLHDLFVDPSARNAGVGRLLIEHVYEHAKTLPAHSVYWHTQYFNHRAQLLYAKVAERTDFVMYSKSL